MSVSQSNTHNEMSEAEVLEYLKGHEAKELLRFVTVGSVDDGKSTLIGRLLYESKGVYEDQLASVKKATENKGNVTEGDIDFSLITDGLKSEREQGITIDVAYRYFSTEKRKFIIADTPGHVQYTRNMATGASTADVAIILIDARLGVLQQSKRHAYIASLLGIPNLIVAINKMDLKNYSQEVFEGIQKDFNEFVSTVGFRDVTYIPVSALKGDNIVQVSDRTDWYDGNTVLSYLETVNIETNIDSSAFYYPVQYVIRPDLNFRGFAGTVASGDVCMGDEIMALPSGKTSTVKSIETYDGPLERAFQDQAVTITLNDEIDISRGNVLVKKNNSFHVSHQLRAYLVWMNEEPLKLDHSYLIKHANDFYQGSFKEIEYKLNMDTLEKEASNELGLNDIGEISLSMNRPLIMDLYPNNRKAGAFIVVDRMTNLTVAAGMISGLDFDEQQDLTTLAQALKSEERAKHFGQKPSFLCFTGRPGSAKIIVARALERRLFEAGHLPYVLDPARVPDADRHATGQGINSILNYADVIIDSGAIAISAFTMPMAEDRKAVAERFGQENILTIYSKVDIEVAKKRLEGLNRDPSNAQLNYEEPTDPDIVIDANELNVSQTVDKILIMLKSKGFIR